MHGKYTTYYENGQLCKSTTYKNDQKHGEYIEYYTNGEMRVNTTYHSGQKI
jgi:antitoxin component YwqK of YwqJK toxin-antitoxin module